MASDPRAYCFKLLKKTHKVPDLVLPSPRASCSKPGLLPTPTISPRVVLLPQPHLVINRKPLRERVPRGDFVPLLSSEMYGKLLAHRVLEQWDMRDGSSYQLCEICYAKQMVDDMQVCRTKIPFYHGATAGPELFRLLRCDKNGSKTNYQCVAIVWQPLIMPGWVMLENKLNHKQTLLAATDAVSIEQKLKTALRNLVDLPSDQTAKVTIVAQFELVLTLPHTVKKNM